MNVDTFMVKLAGCLAVAVVFLATSILLMVVYTPVAQSQEVTYCYDRSTFPTKVVIVAKGQLCPSGYYP